VNFLIPLAIGLAIGVVIVLVLVLYQRKATKEIAKEILTQSESQKIQDLDVLVNRMKDSFGALSLKALSENTNQFLSLANETFSKQTQSAEKDIQGKKELIDQTLESMRRDLKSVEELMKKLEKDRERKFGELSSQLESSALQTGKLHAATEQLVSALANSRVRGQWGERMAQDVLDLAGFIEGINYRKQVTNANNRPDYTFLLPNDKKLNMDVKFPLDNYMHYLKAESEPERDRYKQQFLTNVRSRIKEVNNREYINPEQNTLDYVLIFIPNDRVYSFINEHDGSLLDEAMKNKVVLCSPVTLYAILVVIRQAIDNFTFEKRTGQVLSLLGTFRKQFKTFMDSFEKMGKKLSEAQDEFNKLTTTRQRQLERPLREIDNLRMEKGIKDDEPDAPELPEKPEE